MVMSAIVGTKEKLLFVISMHGLRNYFPACFQRLIGGPVSLPIAVTVDSSGYDTYKQNQYKQKQHEPSKNFPPTALSAPSAVASSTNGISLAHLLSAVLSFYQSVTYFL